MDNSSNYSSSSGDEAQTMPRPNSSRGRAPKHIELDLSAVINGEQRFHLQRLIINIVDEMQMHIRDNFDHMTPVQVEPGKGINPPKAVCTSIPNPRSEKYRHLYEDTGSDSTNTATTTTTATESDVNKDKEKENVKPSNQPTRQTDATTSRPQKPLWKIPKSPEDVQKMLQKTDAEVLVSSLSELKRDCLTHFSKWRVAVLKRINDIVVKNGGTSGNVGGQAPQHALGNTRRPGNAQRGRLPMQSDLDPSIKNPSATLAKLYPPINTSLKDYPREKRALILHSVLLIVLGLDQYSLYSRILLIKLASSLNVPMWILSQDEVRVAQGLSQIIKGIPIEDIVQKRAEEARASRRWKPGTSGGALSGSANTGELAPALAAARIGTVFGGMGHSPAVVAGLLGSMNESTVIVGTLFGLYGARAGCKTIDGHGKDILDFGMIPLHATSENEIIDPKDVSTDDRRMRVTIGVSGMLTKKDDFPKVWNILGRQYEAYALRWELDALTKVGNSLEILSKSLAWAEAQKEIGSRTVFDRLTESYWPAGLVKISKVIENPWCVGMVRAEKAGSALADILVNRLCGERPVSLIGYSLGARVIYSCLMTLAEKRAFGLVENVVMMGAPCPSEVRVWATMRSVVGGRLINAWSRNDYMLGFLYRSSAWYYGVAGLQPVQGAPNVDNFDVSDVVTSHLRYCHLSGSILKKIGWEDIDYDQVLKEQQALGVQMDAEEKLRKERKEREDRNSGKTEPSQDAKTDTNGSDDGFQTVTNKSRRAKSGTK